MKQLPNTLFLVYLFSYVQISPALQQNYPKYDDSSIEYFGSYDDSNEDYPINNQINSEESTVNEIDKRSTESEVPILRTKRFFGAVIGFIAGLVSATAANVIGDQINRAINRGNEGGGSTSRQNAIEITINNNYYAAAQFKNRVARMNPQAAQGIIINRNGLECDSNFCRRFGAGQHSIGICSPSICHCSNGIPYKQACGQGTVFDPVYRICNWAYNVNICGA